MIIPVPIHRLYVPIVNRRDEGDVTIVEGYAYVNGRTKSDKYDLTRSAMEDATPDYAKFGNVREMHTNNAAGTLTGEWDETGFKVVARVVDDGARKKVNEGVYKGFSVGVKPTVVRGDVITACSWYETSLVDRPADHDALFSVTRLEASDESAEADVEETPEAGDECEPTVKEGDAGIVVEPAERVERGTFAERIAEVEKNRLTYAAFDLLQSTIWDIQYQGGEGLVAKVSEACAEFAEYLAPIVARGEFAEPGSLLRSAVAELKPIERAVVDGDGDLQRAEFQNALKRMESENGALTRRVDELAAQPTTARPVLNVAAVERTFQQQPRTRDEIEADDSVSELQRVMALPPAATETEMLERAQTVSRLKVRIGRIR